MMTHLNEKIKKLQEQLEHYLAENERLTQISIQFEKLKIEKEVVDQRCEELGNENHNLHDSVHHLNHDILELKKSNTALEQAKDAL